MSLWLWMFWIFGNVWSVKISRALRRNIWHFMFVLFFSDSLWFTTVGNSKGARPHIPFIFSFYISAIPALFISYIFKATVWAKKKEIQIPYTKPNSLLRTRTAQNINSVGQNFICFIGYSGAPHWPVAAMGFSYLNIKVSRHLWEFKINILDGSGLKTRKFCTKILERTGLRHGPHSDGSHVAVTAHWG